MMKNRFVVLLCVLLCWPWFSPVYAQDDHTCPALVSDALAAVDSLCEETGRNQACYGNVTLTVEAQEGVESLKFETPGDIAKVADIQSLALSPMDETAGEWGISLMQLQANLPDTLPGQNVTMLLFGDVAIKNAVGETSDTYTPMQAFYFRSGVGDAPCAEAPESGILIQTPEGAGKVEIVVNEVTIQLGSTAFLQAAPDDALYVNLLEGQATVTAFDKTKTVPAGMVVSVPVDANLAASGPPSTPEPYDGETIEGLAGVVASLPDSVVPSDDAVKTVVDESGGCTVTAGGNINLRSGPGTVYARAGGLAANDSATPTGQVMGVDGFTWWQLAGGNWVRSDVVEATGDCQTVPVVIDVPPTPISEPVSAAPPSPRATAQIVVIEFPTGCTPDSLPYGSEITLDYSLGYPSVEAANVGMGTDSFGASVNGQALAVTSRTVYPFHAGGAYIQNQFYWGIPEPGAYAIAAIDNIVRTCTITVTVP